MTDEFDIVDHITKAMNKKARDGLKPWEEDNSEIPTMENENFTSCLFEWRCEECLKEPRSDDPKVCIVVSRNKPGCWCRYMSYRYTRSLEPVTLKTIGWWEE